MLSGISGKAQLKVWNNGTVDCGYQNGYTEYPEYKLLVRGAFGTTKMTLHSWTKVFFDFDHGWCGEATIFPELSGYLTLGMRYNRVYMWAEDVHARHVYEDSDERIKENIIKIGNVMDKVKMVNPVNYNLKSEIYSDKSKILNKNIGKKQYGFLAQEMEKIFPEVVTKDSAGNYSLSYTRLVPILFAAVQTQQNQIDSLSKELEKMQKNNKLKSGVVSEYNYGSNIHTDKILLYQNNPNSFSENTTIKYYLPVNTTNAKILIYDLQGVLQKTILLYETGNGSVEIYGGELKSGVYVYGIFADGFASETKQMILTK